MDAILNSRPEDLEDYYALLGCDELSSSMHWAVRSKNEPMLVAPGIRDSLSPGKAPDRHGEQDCSSSTSKLDQMGLSGGKTTEKTPEDEEPQSPKTLPSPNGNYWHLRFRWSADTPSELLRKFRNYEI